MEEEQAVSRLILGPLRLKNHDILLDMIAAPLLVAWFFGRSSGSTCIISIKSRVKHPMKHEVREPDASSMRMPAIKIERGAKVMK